MALIHDMLNQLNDGNYQFTIGHLMDISVLVRSNSTVLGSLSVLSESVRFSIAVPKQMQISGRVFKVLRIHDNHISVIESEYNNGIEHLKQMNFLLILWYMEILRQTIK